MTDAELLALFRLTESDRVERKEGIAASDRIRQAICAHANDLPNHRETGVIFIGQRDDLSCAGLPIDDRLLLGFIERFGVGIAIARERLAANGNPSPEFTVEDAHVLVTIRPRS